MMRFFILTVYLVSLTTFFACGGAEEAKGPVIQPKKEATWVRTEKIKITTGQTFSRTEKKLADIPINASLVEKMTTNEKPDLVVKLDEASCLARLDSLNIRRTLVQKSGGMWGAFERNADSKQYSFYGMQLDSNVNKMIFSLRYLCKTSDGVPLNNVAIEFKKLVQDHGREETIKILLSRGEHPEDIEVFLNYEEFARKIGEREIDFKVINPRLNKAERIIDLYDELSKNSSDKQSADMFLSNSVTLLKVMNEFLKTDQIMAMAVNEEELVPYHHLDQDM